MYELRQDVPFGYLRSVCELNLTADTFCCLTKQRRKRKSEKWKRSALVISSTLPAITHSIYLYIYIYVSGRSFSNRSYVSCFLLELVVIVHRWGVSECAHTLWDTFGLGFGNILVKVFRKCQQHENLLFFSNSVYRLKLQLWQFELRYIFFSLSPLLSLTISAAIYFTLLLFSVRFTQW